MSDKTQMESNWDLYLVILVVLGGFITVLHSFHHHQSIGFVGLIDMMFCALILVGIGGRDS